MTRENSVNPLPSLTLFLLFPHHRISVAKPKIRVLPTLTLWRIWFLHCHSHLVNIMNNSEHKHLYFWYLIQKNMLEASLFFFFIASLQTVGCSECSCCVSEITLAFNLTKSLCLKRGSVNWQAAPTDVGASHTVCFVFNGEGSVAYACVRASALFGTVGLACGRYRLAVRWWVLVAAWWHLLCVWPAYPLRFVWQLYDVFACVCVCAGFLSETTPQRTPITHRWQRENLLGTFYVWLNHPATS